MEVEDHGQEVVAVPAVVAHWMNCVERRLLTDCHWALLALRGRARRMDAGGKDGNLQTGQGQGFCSVAETPGSSTVLRLQWAVGDLAEHLQTPKALLQRCCKGAVSRCWWTCTRWRKRTYRTKQG